MGKKLGYFIYETLHTRDCCNDIKLNAISRIVILISFFLYIFYIVI